MKFYEIYFILKPTLRDEEIETLKGQAAEVLHGSGFKITSSETKLAERLSYRINQHERAHTLTLQVSSDDDKTLGPEVERLLKYNENILRQAVFSKNEKELKRTKPVSVIDQLRQRERRVGLQPTHATNRPAGTTSHIKAAKPHAADVEAIDKKLEELLK